MSLLFYGDPHGEWRPLLEAVADDPPAAVVILGDCDLVRPLRAELAPVLAAGAVVAYLYGNHDKDLPEFWDNLVGDSPGALLHAEVRRLGPYDVAAVAGVFRQRIWLPPSLPLFGTRSGLVGQLAHYRRWRGGLPLRQRDAIFHEDFLALAGETADILVVHEAPSSHRHGFEALDGLARDLRVRLVIHGHHHESYAGATRDGIAVVGLGKAEVLRLRAGELFDRRGTRRGEPPGTRRASARRAAPRVLGRNPPERPRSRLARQARIGLRPGAAARGPTHVVRRRPRRAVRRVPQRGRLPPRRRGRIGAGGLRVRGRHRTGGVRKQVAPARAPAGDRAGLAGRKEARRCLTSSIRPTAPTEGCSPSRRPRRG